MQQRDRLDREPNLLLIFIYISVTTIYVYGIINLLNPYRRNFILSYTPFILLLSTIIVTIFDKGYRWRKYGFLPHSIIIVVGFLVEVVGCNLGFPFGEYCYGDTLGYKVLNTPLLIGINWLFLTVASRGAAAYLVKNSILLGVIATAIMLGYDMVLERVAPSMDMWVFANGYAPINNYIAWGVVSAIMQFIAHRFKIGIKRSFFAAYLLVLQTALLLSQLTFN